MKLKYIYILLFICCISNLYAQKIPYQDTITVSVEGRLSATIAFQKYRDFIVKNSVFDDLENLKKNILRAKAEIPVYQNYKIDYKPGISLIITEGEHKKTFRLEENVIKTINYTYECKIIASDYNMHLFFSDINDLTNTDLKAKITAWMQNLQKEKFSRNTIGSHNKTKVSNLDSLRNDSLEVKLDLFMATRKRCELMILPAIGVSVVKNQLLNNFSASAGVVFRPKGVNKFMLYTSLRGLSTFENDKIHMNTFLYFGWRINTSEDIKKPIWGGWEFGHIIKNQGEFFVDNQRVLSAVVKYGMVTVFPEVYYTGFFKNSYPGFRVQLGL